MEIISGSRIAHYEIISTIGAGGMGEVYLAQDTKLGRKVAIKLLSAEFTKNEDRVRRFEREARAASILNHPNILVVHEIGEVNATHYIATEYVDGQTLRKRIHSGEIDLQDALEIAIQTTAGLAEAHKNGIVHRDIKPENIMLRPDGILKILDFGLAKLSEAPVEKQSTPDPEAATLLKVDTDPGTVMGTVTYMSPEQARGLKTDERTDIFSTGVVLFEMLTGEAPFTGETPSDIIAAILRAPEPQLSTYCQDVPAELQRIVTKALEKNRDERYQTMKDLQLDLKRLKQQLELESYQRPSGSDRTASKRPTATAENAHQSTSDQSAARTVSSAEYLIGGIRQHKGAAFLSVAIIAILAIATGAYLRSRNSEVAIDSIAVLPFVNQSSDADSEYLSDGLTESTINSLAHMQNLRVIARSSVFRYKGKNADPMIAGKELGVRAVLTGRVVQHGDNLAISVELADIRDNKQLWGTRFERKASDLLLLQSEIAREISSNLQPRLSGAEKTRIMKRYTENEEAYQLYMKGRFYWNKRTGEALKKSVDYYNQAIDKDPNYAMAYAGLADSYLLIPAFAGGQPQEYYPMAKTAAQKALSLDDSLAEAHTSLALAISINAFNISESNREFERAIELNPNYAIAHQWYSGGNLVITKQFDKAIAEGIRAVELDPLSAVINADLSEVYLWARQYDKAIEQARKALELDPTFYYTHFTLGSAYELKGMYAEARAEFEKGKQSDTDPFFLVSLARVNAKTGRKDEALKILDQVKQMSKERYVSPYFLASGYASLGDRDQTFEWLEKAYQAYSHDALGFMDIDPSFDQYHSDPQYQDLKRRLGLDKY